MQCSVLKMINKDLRIHSWRFSDDTAVTEALLQFSVHTYRNSVRVQVSSANILAIDRQMDAVEREFIFSLACKLGISSLGVFSENWQSFLSCQELQQLVVMLADKDNVDTSTMQPPPQLMRIIMEFYESGLFHDEDSCLLLTKYVRPSDGEYGKIVEMIVQNAHHYDTAALFHLAQLQAANRRGRKDVMDSSIFSVITKAFENLKGTPSVKLLEYIGWVFSMCTSNRREPAKSPFYTRLMTLVCSHSSAHTDVLLRVLQRMESHGSLMKHSTATQLGLALVARYREHFLSRFRDCGHAAYAAIISEMIRARLECRHYVKNGEVMFDTEVIEVIRRSHQTKKKLMKLLSADFPEHSKSTSL